jgi:hypothetical protein
MGGEKVALTELNQTELRKLYKDRFGVNIGRIKRKKLIEALENNRPFNEEDDVDLMRSRLILFIRKYWDVVKNQIKCSGLCFNCPDACVASCYIDNMDQIEEEQMAVKRCGLNPKTDYSVEDLEEAGAQEDHAFLLQACMHRDMVNVSDAGSLNTEDLWSMLKKKMNDTPQKPVIPEEEPKKKKRGRPPGAKNKKAAAKKTPGKRGRPPKKKTEEAPEPEDKAASVEVDLTPILDGIKELAVEYEAKSQQIMTQMLEVEKSFSEKLKYVLALAGFEHDTAEAFLKGPASPFVKKSSK